jgi:hypothetical protein
VNYFPIPSMQLDHHGVATLYSSRTWAAGNRENWEGKAVESPRFAHYLDVGETLRPEPLLEIVIPSLLTPEVVYFP